MDVTAAEEARLQPEATTVMAEVRAVEACDWAAAPQHARFFLPFL